MTKSELCAEFHGLHCKGRPLVLPNIWDAGSAKAVADAGAKALATSSWAIAAAHGFSDGEEVPLAFIIANLGRIDEVSRLPMTVDFERGYGESLDALKSSFGQLLATCAVGCNLEDGERGGASIRAVRDQVSRLIAAREIVDPTVPSFFINARTDLFLQAPGERHADEQLVSEAVERARAYQQAGADGFFVPGLTNLSVLGALAEAVELPINVMAGDEAIDGYAKAGVARISFGPLPYLRAMSAVTEFAVERLRVGRLNQDTLVPAIN